MQLQCENLPSTNSTNSGTPLNLAKQAHPCERFSLSEALVSPTLLVFRILSTLAILPQLSFLCFDLGNIGVFPKFVVAN